MCRTHAALPDIHSRGARRRRMATLDAAAERLALAQRIRRALTAQGSVVPLVQEIIDRGWRDAPELPRREAGEYHPRFDDATDPLERIAQLQEQRYSDFALVRTVRNSAHAEILGTFLDEA